MTERLPPDPMRTEVATYARQVFVAIDTAGDAHSDVVQGHLREILALRPPRRRSAVIALLGVHALQHASYASTSRTTWVTVLSQLALQLTASADVDAAPVVPLSPAALA